MDPVHAKWTTSATPGISSPREATSVAINTPAAFHRRNSGGIFAHHPHHPSMTCPKQKTLPEDFKRYLNSQAPHACCVMSLTSLSSCAFLSFSWVFGDRTLVNYHVTSRAVWPTLWGWNIHHLKIYLSSTGTALLHCQNTRAEPQTKSC